MIWILDTCQMKIASVYWAVRGDHFLHSRNFLFAYNKQPGFGFRFISENRQIDREY